MSSFPSLMARACSTFNRWWTGILHSIRGLQHSVHFWVAKQQLRLLSSYQNLKQSNTTDILQILRVAFCIFWYTERSFNVLSLSAETYAHSGEVYWSTFTPPFTLFQVFSPFFKSCVTESYDISGNVRNI